MTQSSSAPFIHLRFHSAYSLAEGAIRIDMLPQWCAKWEMPALGISDTNNLFGALEFADTLSAHGVQPLMGCTLNVDLEISGEDEIGYGRGAQGHAGREEHVSRPIALIAQNETGYQNLIALSSQAFREAQGADSPHVKLSFLAAHAGGLIALTGGRHGPLDPLLFHDQTEQARHVLQKLAALFTGRLYVEVQRHGDAFSAAVEPGLIKLAHAYDLPLVATNEPYFPTRDMVEAHDALLCIADGAYLSEQDRRRVTPEHYLKTPEEMTTLFADLPEAIAATAEIARRCAFMPEKRAPILPRYQTQDALDEEPELRRQAEAGLKDRLSANEMFVPEKEYWDRLHFELNVISKMDFPGYFLIVADFIKWAKGQGIPVGPGRGSGAGSVVAWALTITDLDPLRFGLLFERFLNPERISMPDFDIDFCQDRRDEVIQYVQDKYGHDRVAQIITFGKLQARAVMRDVGRVLQMPYPQVDKICKQIPNNPAAPVTLQQALNGEPELQAMRESDETVDRLMTIALQLEGLYRHASTHAAGVVISDRPLEELVPVYRDPRSDMPVTQFSLLWVEQAGLVKFDFLGLKTLTVIDQACRLLAARGIKVDPVTLPLDDDATYAMLARGDSTGVFQFESSGMRDLLRQAEPSTFEDLIALVALFRPGPMENIPKYLASKHGREEPEILHEMLQPIVKETYGVIIYQEQVMQIAQVLSGFSLGEADVLRRAMGKKKKDEMRRLRKRFIDGAVDKGVERDQAGYIFDMVDKFAGYGFNKSHSAGYALLAYQTAYLKANYPVEFYAASMSLDKGNTDKLHAFHQDASLHEITILPPDINRSQADFSTDDGRIVYALSAIKNVGAQAMREIVSIRDLSGPFKDLFDFARRVNPQSINKRALENLARSGAFDSLIPNRAQVFEAITLILGHATQAAHDRTSNQQSLFGEDSIDLATPSLPLVADWLPVEKLNREMEAIGFFLSGHPLDDYQQVLRRRQVVTYEDLSKSTVRQASIVNLAGIVVRRQNRRSQKSDTPYAFLTLSDPSSSFEMLVFSDLLASHGALLEAGEAVVITAAAEWEGDELKLVAKTVRLLDEVVAGALKGLRLFIHEAEAVAGVHHTLEHLPPPPASGGRTQAGQIHLVLMCEDGCTEEASLTQEISHVFREVEVELPGRFPIGAALRGALKAIPGVADIQEL